MKLQPNKYRESNIRCNDVTLWTYTHDLGDIVKAIYICIHVSCGFNNRLYGWASMSYKTTKKRAHDVCVCVCVSVCVCESKWGENINWSLWN